METKNQKETCDTEKVVTMESVLSEIDKHINYEYDVDPKVAGRPAGMGYIYHITKSLKKLRGKIEIMQDG